MKVCPDTNWWIARAQEPGGPPPLRGGEVFLTAIVLQELWAGARSARERAYAERLYDAARRHRRLLNPPTAAWVLSGQALQVLARRRRFSAPRLRALRNDVLLVATAYVYGAAVMTHDAADFAVITEVLAVRVVSPP
ncbi:MAG: type II toxin-antitoxin system VapC family toxin [Gemmatimonadota bacterium]